MAALAAEFIGAQQVIFGTDVDGVYSDDPRKNPAAKKIDRITYEELRVLSTQDDNILPGIDYETEVL